jgi:metacaspase-1
LAFTVSLFQEAKQGIQLANSAASLLRGGFSISKVGEAKQIFSSARSLYQQFTHRNDPDGLGEEHFAEDWHERKDVWMFSGE